VDGGEEKGSVSLRKADRLELPTLSETAMFPSSKNHLRSHRAAYLLHLLPSHNPVRNAP
jgi:hypothetical protein